jgi:hypothetical protein
MVKVARRSLFILHAFVGIGALAGGLAAITNPEEPLGVTVDALKNSPFENFLIPGIILFTIIGLGNILSATTLALNSKFQGYISSVFSWALVIWIVVQCIMLEDIVPLHIIFFVIGLVEAIISTGILFEQRLFPADFILGQFVAFGMALRAIMRKDQSLHLDIREGFRPDWQAMKSIFNIGIPAMLEQLVMRTGMIIYNKTVASLGTVAFATHNVSMNIQAMSFMNGQAFSVSATSLVGQSLGKKRADMANAYASRTRRVAMTVSLFLGLIFFFFGRNIVGLYTSDAEVIAQGGQILMLVALIQPFQSSQFILTGVLRGAGDTKATAVIIFLTVLLVRPGLAIFNINVLGLGLIGAWIALALDQMLRSFLVLLRYNSGKWKGIRV